MPNNPLTEQELYDYGILRSLTPPAEVVGRLSPPYFPAGYFLVPPHDVNGPVLWRKFHAGYIQEGIIDPERLGTGYVGDGNLYLADDGTWKPVSGGDVPNLQNVTDIGNTTTNSIETDGVTSDYFTFDTSATPTPTTGMMFWDQDSQTPDVQLDSQLAAKMFQDEFWYVKNQTGSQINKGTVVMAVGTLGASSRILVAPMIADGSVPAKYILGIAAENIPDGADGSVMRAGKIRQLNTTAFAAGDVLYANPAVAGGLTNVLPSAPNLKLAVAFVVHSATNGVLAVRVEVGSDLYEDHRVQVTSPTDGQLLRYDNADQRWENWTPNFLTSVPTLDQVTTAGNTTNNPIIIGGTTLPSLGGSIKLLLDGSGGGVSGRTFFAVRNTNAGSAAIFALINSSGKKLSAQISGPSYAVGEQALFFTEGSVPLGFMTDGGLSSGGNSRINFYAGGYNISPTMVITPGNTGNVLIGTTTDAGYKLDVNGTFRATGNADFSGDIDANEIRVKGTVFARNIADVYTLADGALESFNIAGYTLLRAGGQTGLYLENGFGGPNKAGIWTSTPQATLDVNGTFRALLTNATHTSQVYYDTTTGELTYGALPTPATPTLDQVTTAGNTTTNAITVGGLIVDTNTLVVDSVNNRVGIGTATPGFNLDLYGTTLNNPIIRLRTNAVASGGNYANGIIFDRTPGGATNNIGIFTDPSRGHTTNADALTFSLINSPWTRLFTIQQNAGLVLGSYAGVNTAPVGGFIISGNVGIGTPTDSGYKLNVNGTFRATTGTYASTQGLTVDSEGEVIVGGTTGTGGGRALTVNGVSRFNSNIELYGELRIGDVGIDQNTVYNIKSGGALSINSNIQSANANFDYLDLIAGATNTSSITIHGNFSSGRILFRVLGSERMRISDAGNLLVGTTTDNLSNKLQVNGSISATGGTSTQWNEAYGWGNHALVGYLTSYTETDTLDSVVTRGDTTTQTMSVGPLINSTGSFNSKLELSGEGGFHSSKFTFNNQGRFIVGQVSVTGTNDIFFQAAPSTTSGYGVLEAWQSAGMIVGTGGNTSPVIFQVARIERARISSTGNLLVGTTVDSGLGKLQVKGSGSTSSSVALTVTNSSDVSSLMVADNNSVFIGRVSTYRTNNAGLYVGNGEGDFTTDLVIDSNSTNNSLYKLVIKSRFSFANPFSISTPGTATWFNAYVPGSDFPIQGHAIQTTNIISLGTSAITSEIPAGGLFIHGQSFYNQAAIVRFTSYSTGTASSTRGATLGLWTDNHFRVWNYEDKDMNFGTNNLERLTIKNTGDVGIGTNSPSAKLDVIGNIATNQSFIVNTTSATQGLFITANNPRVQLIDTVGGSDISYMSNTNGDLNFGSNWNFNFVKTGSATFTLKLTNTQNVLIGTNTDAGYKLDVNGTARIVNNLNVTGGLDVVGQATVKNYGSSTFIVQETQNNFAVWIRPQWYQFDTSMYFNSEAFSIKYNTTVGGFNQGHIINMRNNGNVMIGGTQDNGFKLEVSGTFRSTGAAQVATSTGGLGVGTTSPGYKLDVNGNGRFVGELFANAALTVGGLLTSPAGKIGVQGGVDGGNSRGIFLWNTNDPNWGIYMANSGAGKSLSGGTAPASLDGRTGQAVRFRVYHESNSSFIWESNNQFGGPNDYAIMSLASNTGNLTTRGSVTSSSFIRTGGTASQFLKADGSVDSSVYVSNTDLNAWNWRWRRWSGTINPAANTTEAWTTYYNTYFVNRTAALDTSNPLQASGYVNTLTQVGTEGGFGGSLYGNMFGDLGNYHVLITTHILVEREFTVNVTNFSGDDAHALFINGVFVRGNTACCSNISYSYTFTPGWYRIDLIYTEGFGGDYIRMGWNPKDYLDYIRVVNPNFTGDNFKYVTNQLITSDITVNNLTVTQAITSNSITTSTLNATGRVGVGTTTPEYAQLQVERAFENFSSFNNTPNSADNFIQRSVFRIDQGTQAMYFGMASPVNDRRGYIQMSHENNAYANATGSIALNPFGGNIGIGTFSPESTLHVVKTGTLDVQTIVVTLASNSRRPVLQFSEELTGTSGVGMSLEYDGRSSGNDNKFYINSTGASPLFTVTNGGNVGIGTTSPSSNLDVFGADAEMLVHYTNNSRGGFRAMSTQRVAVLTTASADDLVFGWENNPKGAFTEHMRLDNGTGNFGIGVVNPNAKLHVAGEIKSAVAANNFGFQIENTNEPSFKYRIYNHGSTAGTNVMTTGLFYDAGETATIRFGRGGGASDGNISFATASVEKMRLTYEGNLGIGTNSPTYKLHVAGTTRNTQTRIDITPTTSPLALDIRGTGTPNDYFSVSNATGGANDVFLPVFFYKAATYGYNGGTNRYPSGVYGGGFIAAVDDTSYPSAAGAGAAMHFNSRAYANNGPLNSRYLFSWGSWLTTHMAMTAGGNLLIGTTTDNGLAKLQVQGQVSADAYVAAGQQGLTISIPTGAGQTLNFTGGILTSVT